MAMKVAAVQMTSGPDVAANLAEARALLEQAAERGARLAVLPENFSFMGLHDADKRAVAEADGSGPVQDFLAASARRLRLWIIAGTVPLRAGADGRVAAASPGLRRRRAPGRALRQDPPVRRRAPRPRRELPRVRARGARSRGAVVDTPVGRARTVGVLRRALSGALPAPERRGRAAARPCRRPSRRRPGARTGRRCCARARSRISVM